tara:strand:+ start:501 stop:1253 length:753 start_codon:yes stop_codon:yes gene_type:complete
MALPLAGLLAGTGVRTALRNLFNLPPVRNIAAGLGRAGGGFVKPKYQKPVPVVPNISPLNRAKSLGILAAPAAGITYGVSGEPEVQPQPTVTATPVGVQEQQEPSARFSQVISPTTSATSKEVLNAALLRAGLSLLQGGSAKEALTAASTVSEARTKFRTGAQALAEGQKNLGSTATIYVSQNKDGTYSYSGRTDANATDFLAKIINQSQQKKVITKKIIDDIKAIPKNANVTEQQIIDSLKAQGYSEEQ